MHHIRRLVQPASGLESPDLNPKALPNELLILIASHVRRRGDLARLIRSSKRFKNVYTSFLYQKIEVLAGHSTSPDVAAQLSLYTRLKAPNYSQLVTEFRVTLLASAICAIHVPSSSILPASLRRCSCDKYDQALGAALLSLHNLEVLVIQCTLCRLKHGHDYILKLDMPGLKQFRFSCKGSSVIKTNNESDSILLAPYIRNLTALALECDYSRVWGSLGPPERFIQDKKVLRDLKVLRHTGDSFSGGLLAVRPIERLCIEGQLGGRDSSLHKNIKLSPGQLTHLFMVDILQWLPHFISPSLGPFRHLTHIGTIAFPYLEDDAALHAMRVFIPLSNLEAIEINRNPFYETSEDEMLFSSLSAGFSPRPLFFTLLGQQHPSLRRVLLQRRNNHNGIARPPNGSDIASVLWERRLDWERRIVSYQDYWDMLHRNLDDV